MLYVKVVANPLSQGPDLVLLHGWGFNGEVWNEILTPLLNFGFRIHIVDLPGHGHSSDLILSATIEDWAAAVCEVVPRGAIWIGWSLGGMVALAAATLNHNVINALIIVGASPRFVNDNDWQASLPPKLLLDFENLLRNNWQATLSRFLALQVLSNHNQQVMRHLRSLIFAHPPDINALHVGLTILQHTDLRLKLSQITCDTLVLLGERDTLVPVAIANDLAQLKPNWKIRVLMNAGHLPFVTHQTEFIKIIKDWLALKYHLIDS